MPLATQVARDLAADVPDEVRNAAAMLARDADALAVLFYGSVLRTGALGDVLDFYVVTGRAGGMASKLLWPDVAWREIAVDGRTLRAKVATMPLDIFERAASGTMLDTTIWTRFAQPAALVWSASPDACARVERAVAAAIVTAGRFAAALGPPSGPARDYWQALFDETYRAEFRVEAPGRSAQIVDYGAGRYEQLLPLAWNEAGIPFGLRNSVLTPRVNPADCRRIRAAWRRRRRGGKPLNIARLVKAAFTFEGATRYALYKIERHTGVAVPMTPWRERHPVLAAPGVLWQVWRTRRAAA